MNRSESWIFSKLDKYMTSDWESVTNFGVYLHGMPKLRKLVTQTLKAFPDIKLHIVDTFCEGKNIDGQWKYTAEWNLPDDWSLYAQIGVYPPHPPKNPQPISDCDQIFDWKTGYLNPKLKPSV